MRRQLSEEDWKRAAEWGAGGKTYCEIGGLLDRRPVTVQLGLKRRAEAGRVATVKHYGDEPQDGPLVRAQLVLNGRARRLSSPGLWLIDGRQGDNRALVRAANRVLAAEGSELIRYPGVET